MVDIDSVFHERANISDFRGRHLGGGKQTQVMIDLNPVLLQSKGLSATDVVNAVNLQNLVLPSGTAKIGAFEYDVELNAAPRTVEELNDLPIKVVGNSTIYLRDLAHVRNGFAPQTNIVRHDGRRGVILTDCVALGALEATRKIDNQLGTLIDLTNLPTKAEACPNGTG